MSDEEGAPRSGWLDLAGSLVEAGAKAAGRDGAEVREEFEDTVDRHYDGVEAEEIDHTVRRSMNRGMEIAERRRFYREQLRDQSDEEMIEIEVEEREQDADADESEDTDADESESEPEEVEDDEAEESDDGEESEFIFKGEEDDEDDESEDE